MTIWTQFFTEKESRIGWFQNFIHFNDNNIKVMQFGHSEAASIYPDEQLKPKVRRLLLTADLCTCWSFV